MNLPSASDLRPACAAQRTRLDALLRDSPACLASLSGPDHMVTVTNQLFRQLFGNRPLAGLSLRAALNLELGTAWLINFDPTQGSEINKRWIL